MTNEIISSRVREIVDTLPHDKKSVVVLKGIPLSLFGEVADLDAAADNPLNYFLRTGGRKFLSHEEFLLTGAFVLAQFDAVYVVTNNLFMEQFPIEENFSADTKKLLLENFAEPEVDDEPAEENFDGRAKLFDLFVGLKDCGNFLAGTFNDEQLLSEPKVTALNLFAPVDVELDEVDALDAPIVDVQEAADFVELVREILFDAPTEIFVRTHNFAGDKEKLNSRLKILRQNFSVRTKIFRVRPEQFKRGFEHRDEYTKILRRHWGYDTFRNFTVYDLQRGRKSHLDCLAGTNYFGHRRAG